MGCASSKPVTSDSSESDRKQASVVSNAVDVDACDRSAVGEAVKDAVQAQAAQQQAAQQETPVMQKVGALLHLGYLARHPYTHHSSTCMY
jgi:hypothetical protein